MPIHHDTPENPSSQEPYFAEKTKPFTEMTGTHPIDANEPVKPLEDGDDAVPITPLESSDEA